MNDSINIILILCELLNGNHDLSHYILCLKSKVEKEGEFLESQDFWIENNFYNWLNHDIVLRKSLKLQETIDISYDSFYNYYNRNEGVLGLEEFRRTRGLSKCFNSPWWKTTVKSTIIWNDIHILINSKIRVFDILEGYEYEDEMYTRYYFDHDLLIEKIGLKKMYYINKVYNDLFIHGGSLFQDISHIFIQGGIIQFLE
tara:strand:+ start:133 stop:732 length:600 start_codon:yes stop_codon:yes gene_type:complete